MKGIDSRPLYSIGIVSELLDVHPETIRTWERSGVVQPPQRRSGKRTFSANDLKRLEFIQKLASEGLSIRAIRYYLRLYPCWQTDDCAHCANCCHETQYTKHCWRETGSFCKAPSSEVLCADCQKRAATAQGSSLQRNSASESDDLQWNIPDRSESPLAQRSG